MNTLGRILRLTTFGESHGPYIGGVIDGCPPGVTIDLQAIRVALTRRKGIAGISTPRIEEDEPQFISGILDGVTTGTPLTFLVPNQNQRSADYFDISDLFRPSHADYTYYAKFGIRDYRGGGRASARETVVRVIAGTIAAGILRSFGVSIHAFTSSLGSIALPHPYLDELSPDELEENHRMGCPLLPYDNRMWELAQEIRNAGDSIGGVASCRISGVPPGIGSPLYGKLSARLSAGMMSIGAAVAFEMGDGIMLARMTGKDANDPFGVDQKTHEIYTLTNHSGGIQGGISNGMEIRFRTTFKPIPSIAVEQQTVDIHRHSQTLHIRGRHDASVFPRVLPVVESMAALVILDEMMINHSLHLSPQ